MEGRSTEFAFRPSVHREGALLCPPALPRVSHPAVRSLRLRWAFYYRNATSVVGKHRAPPDLRETGGELHRERNAAPLQNVTAGAALPLHAQSPRHSQRMSGLCRGWAARRRRAGWLTGAEVW